MKRVPDALGTHGDTSLLGGDMLSHGCVLAAGRGGKSPTLPAVDMHELEEQVKKTVLRLSPSVPSPLPSPARGNPSWPPLCCWSCLDRRSGGMNPRMHTDQGKTTASTTMWQPSSCLSHRYQKIKLTVETI